MNHDDGQRPDAPPPLTDAEAETLTAAILARTSGSVCTAIEERLVRRTDGVLDGLDLELVNEHLARCVPCRGLSDALSVLNEQLPGLAEIDPGPWFTEQVLARTSRAAAPRHRWIYTVVDAWRTLLRRPRIALEFAYVAALLAFLVAGSPAPVVRDLASRSAVFPPGGVAAAVESWELESPLDRIEAVLQQKLESPPRHPVAQRIYGTARRAASTAVRVVHSTEIGGRQTGLAVRAIFRGDLAAVWWAWQDLRGQLRDLWNPASGPAPAIPSTPAGPDHRGEEPGPRPDATEPGDDALRTGDQMGRTKSP